MTEQTKIDERLLNLEGSARKERTFARSLEDYFETAERSRASSRRRSGFVDSTINPDTLERISDLRSEIKNELTKVSSDIKDLQKSNESKFGELTKTIVDSLKDIRSEIKDLQKSNDSKFVDLSKSNDSNLKEIRDEIRDLNKSNQSRFDELVKADSDNLLSITKSNNTNLHRIYAAIGVAASGIAGLLTIGFKWLGGE